MNNDNELLDLYEERVNKYIDEKRKTDDLFDYINRLEERINKAIEYIENHQLDFKKGITTFGSERLSMEERKLLDILKGSDKE